MAEKQMEPDSRLIPSIAGLAPRSVPDEIADGNAMRPRVLLLIEKRGNRSQVAKQMRRYTELLTPEMGALPEKGFDLAIVDNAGLKRWSNELTQARLQERPVFLPVMLLIPRAEMRKRNRLSLETIDEFIVTPIDPVEFFERSAMMLRARQFAMKQRLALENAINHDGSTGLPNRELFLKHLDSTLRQADARGEKLHIVVGHVLMARFAEFLGSGAMEDIAQAFVTELQQNLHGDYFMARLSSELSATALPLGSSAGDVTRFSTQLIESTQRSRLIRGEWVRPATYVGIASFPDDATDAAGLLEAAISAASEAVQSGVPQFYSPGAQDRALQFLRIETGLQRALEQQEFELWFQPKFRLSDLTMTGAEALIRWREPSGELVSPGDFIPVAENAGLIQRVDSWVIESACAALARWRQNGLDCPTIAVNTTPADLAAEGFVSWLKQLIADYGLTSSSISVEMTESMLIDVDQSVQDNLKALRACGIGVSIDDFGTGYSSLSYLQQLPANVLKIDKSFVDHILHDREGQVITNAIIALGEQFGLELVAEGIETQEQLEYLRERGVQTGQGFLVSKPLPEKEFIEAMKNGLSIGSE